MPGTSAEGIPAPQVIDTAEMTIDMRRQAQAKAQPMARSAAQARAAAASAATVDTPGVGLADPQTQQYSRAIPDHLVAPPPQDSRPKPVGTIAKSAQLHLGQLIAWQAAAAAVLLSLGRPLPVTIVVTVLAILVFVVSAGRARGRWLYQWCAIRLRFAQRTHRRLLSEDPARRAGEILDLLSEGAVLSAVRVDNEEFGLIDHANGVTAVLELGGASDALSGDSLAEVPSPDVLLPVSEQGVAPVAVQVLVQTVPAPAPRPAATAVGASYLSVLGNPPTPIQRRVLVAVQAIRTAEDFEPASLRDTLLVTARQVRRRLRKGNFAVRTLTRQELSSVILELTELTSEPVSAPPPGPAGVPMPMPAPDRAEVRETWTVWRSRRTPHTCFRVWKWPDPTDPAGAPLFERMSMTPARANLISVASRQHGDQVEVETVIRTVSHDDAGLATARREIHRSASECHSALQQLDGDQAYGVAATLPFGGFLQ